MCYRESFCLLPLSSPVPVAWTVSYHHEHILKALFPDDHWRNQQYLTQYRGGGNSRLVQIECIGGDVKKWDWDNTPYKLMAVAEVEQAAWIASWINEVSAVSSSSAKIKMTKVYELPGWLEDFLPKYQNRIESILERINPLRDRQDKLIRDVLDYLILRYPRISQEHPFALFTRYQAVDSSAVQEFIRIVNEYCSIPGFVMQESQRDELMRKSGSPIDFDYRRIK